jgi:hypothetical protein
MLVTFDGRNAKVIVPTINGVVSTYSKYNDLDPDINTDIIKILETKEGINVYHYKEAKMIMIAQEFYPYETIVKVRVIYENV